MKLFFWRKKPAPQEPTVERKYASVYLFPDHFIFHSQVHTPFGLYASEPYQRLPHDAPPHEIGYCVRLALEASRDQKDSPGGKEFAKTYLKSMGVKSNAQLQRSAQHVSVVQSRPNIEFSPSHNGGAIGDEKGYRPIAGLTPLCILADAPPAEIGTTLLKAFSLCTSVYT